MSVHQDLEIVAAILTVGLAPMLLEPPDAGAGTPVAAFGAGRANAATIVRLHREVLSKLIKPATPAATPPTP